MARWCSVPTTVFIAGYAGLFACGCGDARLGEHVAALSSNGQPCSSNAACTSGICEDGICCAVACGLCSSCDGTGTSCTVVPADDPACGVVDCNGLDWACRDYQSLTTDRCKAAGQCKVPNSSDCTSFTNQPAGTTCGTTPLSDNFESGFGKWTTADWGASYATSHSPTTSAQAPGAYGQYSMQTAQGMRLADAPAPTLTFWYRFHGDDPNPASSAGYVDISTDGGTTWSNVWGVCCTPYLLPWAQVTISLPRAEVWIRFRVWNVGCCNALFFVDDVAVTRGDENTCVACDGTGACSVPAPTGASCGACKACDGAGIGASDCTAAAANGFTCNDGNACTTGDVCTNGTCSGTAVTCTPLDQCHEAGFCNPATGVCTNPQVVNGRPCNDGNACTTDDICVNGTCGGTAVSCAGHDQCHLAGTCDPATGCINPPVPNGTPCFDGNACTTGDVCTNGTCSGTAITCTPLDQCHVAGTCNPSTGCSNPPAADGTACNDGNACTTGDVCFGGVCGGATITCTALDQCHVAGTCNPATGACSNPPAANGTACNDGNACTTRDVCASGTCAGTAITCAALDQCHVAGTCDSATGACSNPPAPNGRSCNDGNACTTGDVCANGICSGAAISCAPLDQCHVAGTCNPTTGTCSNPPAPNGTSCNDGNACTAGDVCTNGTCGGTPIACSALDQCHVAGTCNPATGACSNPPAANGSVCNDGNPCTTSDTCTNGTCGGTAVVCTAQDQCHLAGICNPATGACSSPPAANGTPCNDNSLCTSGETCQNGACTPASTVTCSALDQCHQPGTCDPTTGQCSNPTKPNGTPCDDGRSCTTGDACQVGICTPTANNCACSTNGDCTPLDQCHLAGSCDPSSGTCTNPNAVDGTPCDDANACTSGESCQNGACGTPTSTVTCAALDMCHDVGTCDPATGQCSNPTSPNGTPCDDGRACTTGDSCQSGACTPSANLCACATDADCVPLDQCHIGGTCDRSTGICTNPPKGNGIACDDGNACTAGETCQNGACGSPTSTVTCSALDECHDVGVCDTSSGTCSNPTKPDGTPCTGGLCNGGVCVTPTDAAPVDAATPDGSTPDARAADAAIPDAAIDAAKPDAAITPDAGGPDASLIGEPPSGCGCRIGGMNQTDSSLVLTIMLLGVMHALRSSRRRR